MEFKNIHFSDPGEPLGDQDEPAMPTAPTVADVAAALPEKMRIRRTTVSPQEEYQLRTGSVQPISQALASMILSCNGRAEVSAKGIKVVREDLTPEFRKINNGVRFWHEDSIICSDLSHRARKWFYVLNRLKPDCVHLLDEHGTYVETLPREDKPHVLDPEEQARTLAKAKRAFNRTAKRLQDLHGAEAQEAIERMRENNELATRYVQTLDAAAEAGAEPVQPLRTPTADAMRAAEVDAEEVGDRRQSAVELGRAVTRERTQVTSRHQEETPIEQEQW